MEGAHHAQANVPGILRDLCRKSGLGFGIRLHRLLPSSQERFSVAVFSGPRQSRRQKTRSGGLTVVGALFSSRSPSHTTAAVRMYFSSVYLVLHAHCPVVEVVVVFEAPDEHTTRGHLRF